MMSSRGYALLVAKSIHSKQYRKPKLKVTASIRTEIVDSTKISLTVRKVQNILYLDLS